MRRLLGETEERVFIETVPTRGYRFLVPVRILPPAVTAAFPLRRPGTEDDVAPAAALPPAVASPPGDTTAVDGRPFRWWPWGLAAGLVTLVGVVWVASRLTVARGRDVGAAVGASVTSAPDATLRLTSNVADDSEPAVSPDGRTVAFVSNRDGVPAIYLLALDRRDEPPGRVRTSGPARAPSWSPDGSRLAFVCQRDGQADICLVGRDGSNERVVAAQPQDELDPVWSPDGRHLAYSIVGGRTWEVRVIDLDIDGAPPRRADVSTGGAGRLVGADARVVARRTSSGRVALADCRGLRHLDDPARRVAADARGRERREQVRPRLVA